MALEPSLQASSSPAQLAIEIGGTKLQLAAGHGDGQILSRRRFQIDAAAGASGIRRHIEAALPELLGAWSPVAVAAGFGGPVDRASGRVVRSHQIEGWADFNLRDWLEGLCHRPVILDNDANMGALGEATCGAGTGCNPVLYVTLGSGVGGGLVVDGGVYHGASPGEAEVGHLRLDREGTLVENRCSGWAVDAKIRRLTQLRPDGSLARRVRESPGHEARHLAGALQAGDPTAMDVLRDTARDLAFGLSHAVHLFHPEVIVLGGGLALVGDTLREAVAGALGDYVMEAFQPRPTVALAALGEDAVLAGCLAAAAP